MPSSDDISGRSFFGNLTMTASEHEEVGIRRAQSLADYLFLRTLRNRVRQYMTNNTASIGFMQQIRFYLRTPANVEIYIARRGGKRVGYLLLQHIGTTTLITEAVDASHRGSGIGTRMVRYAQQHHPDLTAEIRIGNTASVRLHEASGFTLAGTRDDVQCYRYSRSDAQSGVAC